MIEVSRQPELVDQERGLPDAFRRIYYHLYSNSNASRYDRIIHDLSLLLLAKLASDRRGGDERLARYVAGGQLANDTLLELLNDEYPGFIEDGQRFTLDEPALRAAMTEVFNFDLAHAPAHVLGEAFQALMGPRLRGEKGQFFTPRSLVRAMVEIISPTPGESILDPACGTGGFLTEAFAFQQGQEGSETGRQASIVGVDKDADLARLASALLRMVSGESGFVATLDSLDPESWRSAGLADSYDVILTNPPFGARIGVKSKAILQEFDLGHHWIDNNGRFDKSRSVMASQDPQTLFLELCVRKLNPGGRLGIVLPEGMFGNRKSGYIWDWLRDLGDIEVMLDCPRTTFQPGTDTKTNVLFFRRHGTSTSGEQQTSSPTVHIGIAMNCGHDRRGRTELQPGEPFPDDFGLLAQSFRGDREGWHEVEIADAHYLVPRYHARNLHRLTELETEITAGAEWLGLGQMRDEGMLTIRKGHEVGSGAYGTGEIPFVRTSDISNYEVKADPTKSVSEEIYQQYAEQQRLAPGDILLVADGRYRIGTSAILTQNTVRCVVQSHLRIIGPGDSGAVDPYSLLFALNLPTVRMQLRDLAFVQSTLGTLGRRLLELQVPVLQGPGPWGDRVMRFRVALEDRDRLLAEMRNVVPTTGADL